MTIVSADTLNTTYFQDGQAPGSITPLDMRVMIDSVTGLVATTRTATYTATLTDRGTLIEMNAASGVNFTVPPNSSVAFDVGTVMEICQYGTGQVTVAPGAGVTLRTATGTLTTRAQYSVVSVRKRATDEWVVSGDLS